MYKEFVDEFIDLVDQRRDRHNELTTREIIKTMEHNGWLGFFAMKREVIKAYYYNQLKLGWSAKDARMDAAVAYGVTESYVRDLVYKHTVIK